MLNALGAAGLALMVADPRTFLGPSPVLERTSQRYLRRVRHLESTDFDRTLAARVAEMRVDLRMIAGRLARFLGRACACGRALDHGARNAGCL
jgi:hypothetical protein